MGKPSFMDISLRETGLDSTFFYKSWRFFDAPRGGRVSGFSKTGIFFSEIVFK